MTRKNPLVDPIMVESFSAGLDILKRNGYDGSMNVSDFYFAKRKILDPIIYGPSVQSDEFACMVRWHSSIGFACKKAILEYFHSKISQHEENITKEFFPHMNAMIEDPEWDKKFIINPANLYVTIDFSDFIFQFENRSLTIRDFTYSFHLSRVGNAVDLIGIDLSGIELRKCRFINICFSRANFDNAVLYQLELINTNFSDATFRHARIMGIQAKQGSFFNYADFTGACVFGIYPLGDSCLSLPFFFNEISYIRLVSITIERFLRFGPRKIVGQQPSSYTGFANNPTNEMTLPSTKALKEYIIWYQRTLQKVDRLPSISICEGLSFLFSVLTTKHWTSYPALAISAFAVNLFFTGLYASFASHFDKLNIDAISLFYQSVLVFTSFGLDKIKPLTHFGEFIVMSEILFGYITLALFVYLISKKIDHS
jgi:hypothetical protein